MTPDIKAILLGFLLYGIYVLLPLIPSVLIYKMFPDSKVGANGILGSLKINTTGAFAAYIIVVIIGSTEISKIHEMIRSSYAESSAWLVNSKVVFLEQNQNGEWVKSNKVTSDDIRARLEIKTNPDYNQKDLGAVTFMTYSRAGLPKLIFSFPDYESRTIDLSDAAVKLDLARKSLDLGLIEMRSINQVFDPSRFIQIAPDAVVSDTLIPFGGPTIKNN